MPDRLMVKLPVLKPRQVIRALRRAGFYLHHTTGSHHYYKHPDKPGLRVTVPYHTRNLKRGVLRAIIAQAGMSEEAFSSLL